VKKGFSLVELLVVITIIVLLLALLSPALDQAVYQAELATCSARLRALGVAVTGYAIDFQRSYPYRSAVVAGAGRRPDEINLYFPPDQGNHGDDRPVIRDYIDINGLLQCPLTRKVDLVNTEPATQVYSSYSLWYSWGWRQAPVRHKAMRRLGDWFEWDDINDPNDLPSRFTVLAADMDTAQNYSQASHPDKTGRTAAWTVQDELVAPYMYTFSLWYLGGSPNRGPIDRDFVFQDGSVERYTDLQPFSDDRLVTVPGRCNTSGWVAKRTWLPRS